jgi:long-chain acyl-CoA synthetase
MLTPECPSQNLTAGFFRVARQFPRQTAIITARQQLSYEELANCVTVLAGQFQQMGLVSGESVALLLHNTIGFVSCYYALLSLGVTVVPLNYRLTAQEITPLLQDIQTRFLVSSCHFHPVLHQLDSPFLETLILETAIQEDLETPHQTDSGADAGTSMQNLLSARYKVYALSQLITALGSLDFSEPDFSGEAPPQNLPSLPCQLNTTTTLATIIHTSGTTGKSKGVMLSHHNIASNVQANIAAVQISQTDCLLTTSPLFHVYGQTNVLLSALHVGAKLVLLETFSAHGALQAIERHGVTVLTAVPTMYIMMLARLKERAFNLSSLRVCHSGAAPMSETTFHQIQHLFGQPVQEGYGLSEASSIVCSNPLEGFKKPGSVGPPVAGLKLKVVHLETGDTVPANEVGELWVQGDSVMQGYYQQPEETGTVLIDQADGRWLRTKDLAYMDENGYVTIVNRLDDLMNIGGIKVYPNEIEALLTRHPAIHQAVVFSVPVSVEQQVIHAVLVPKPLKPECPAEYSLPGKEALRAYCMTCLADYKIPKVFRFTDTLPQGATGKILRSVLRQEALNP